MRTLKYLMAMVTVFLVTLSCDDIKRNQEPLVDPWTRERTPASLTLAGQVGTATISNDWRNDDKGTIAVTLVTPEDPASVKVEEITLQYNATANIQAGSVLDFSSGSAQFVVTAETGETRTYTITYDPFIETLEGTYAFESIKGLDDWGKCPYSVIGGWDGNVTYSTPNDKSWQWKDYGFDKDNDNTVSIKLEGVDNAKGVSYGTMLNLAGENGKYATFIWTDGTDLTSYYRIIPEGKSRWARDTKTNVVSIYAYEDTNRENPLYTTTMLTAGQFAPDNAEGKKITVPHFAFYRQFPGPYNDHSDTGDARFQKNNIRDTFTFLNKTDEGPLDNHNDLLSE